MNQTRLIPAIAGDPHGLDELREEVRGFLADERAAGRFEPRADSWLTGWDEEFSRSLAARGWLGMTLPEEYGGHGRSFRERFAVTEELLAAGAPVAAHWIADRQIVPSLLKYGTEEQKQKYLPGIARGEVYFGIGMSEPDSGSDLASVRTKGSKVEGGWIISGTKLWTSGAHHAHAFICLVRTEALDKEDRHAGLSQFIVDLSSPGVQINPIVSMNGEHHFNEVVLDEVFVSEAMLFGTLGNGWEQVTSELGFERSGPERILSTFPLLAQTAAQMGSGVIPRHSDLGRYVGRISALRQMSAGVAEALERHEPADTAAALVKVLGTSTEGDIADFADLLTEPGSEVPSGYQRMIQDSVSQRPGFTLRGGTNEILRGVVARGLGMR